MCYIVQTFSLFVCPSLYLFICSSGSLFFFFLICRDVDPDPVGSGFFSVRGSQWSSLVLFLGNYIFKSKPKKKLIRLGNKKFFSTVKRCFEINMVFIKCCWSGPGFNFKISIALLLWPACPCDFGSGGLKIITISRYTARNCLLAIICPLILIAYMYIYLYIVYLCMCVHIIY